MSLLRPEFEDLEQNGITRVALPRLGDPSVIPLWFGQGDMVTPEFIRAATAKALDEGQTFYTNPKGHPDLRIAIKRYLDEVYDIDVAVERITVPGSTMLGITMASQMALTNGAHGVIVSPNWPNIDRTFQITGAEIDYVRQRESGERWELDMDDVRRALRPNTKALFVNTPCNPTGWVMSREEQQILLDLCRERGILLIADEVYHRNVFDGDVAPSFMSIADEEDPVVVVNGFSKAWAMTGWRMGWMVTPTRYDVHMAVISECFNTSAPTFLQIGSIAALTDGEPVVKELRARYARGREIVMEILGADPRVELLEPQGAFYAFPRVKGMRSSLDFAQRLLAEENVGVAPGYTFGPGNEDHFRLCFAHSHAALEEALRRIVVFLDRHGNEFQW